MAVPHVIFLFVCLNKFSIISYNYKLTHDMSLFNQVFRTEDNMYFIQLWRTTRTSKFYLTDEYSII